MGRKDERRWMQEHWNLPNDDLVRLFDLLVVEESWYGETWRFMRNLLNEGLKTKEDCAKYFRKDGHSVDTKPYQKRIIIKWLGVQYVYFGYSRRELDDVKKSIMNMITDEMLVSLLRSLKSEE